jgi:hypothetical protein
MSDEQALQQQQQNGAVQTRPTIEGVEDALLDGDLSKLSSNQRVEYMRKVCESVGLNPLTKPFRYIRLNGKLTLYATRDAAEQLRKVNGISITQLDESWREDIYIVRAYAKDQTGRTDVATGAVDTSRSNGQSLANDIMKAETKAKRRVTLSLSGLGYLDETEISDIPANATEEVAVNHETGEIEDVEGEVVQEDTQDGRSEQWYENQLQLIRDRLSEGAPPKAVRDAADDWPKAEPLSQWPKQYQEAADALLRQAS